MRKPLIPLATAAGLTLLACALPQAANASCEDRKMTGTVLGGVGGALIGGSIAHGAGGALLGGLGGAVIGHEVAASGCHRYYRREARYERQRYYGPAASNYPPPQAQPMVYYDQFGNPVSPAVTPASAGTPPGYSGGACHVEMRAFYDDRGALVQRPVQVCAP